MEGQIAVLQRDGKARATSIRYYGEALDSLRSVISARSIGPSDHVILAVVVLIAYEAVIGTGTEYVYVVLWKCVDYFLVLTDVKGSRT